jgi:hypothetical protein
LNKNILLFGAIGIGIIAVIYFLKQSQVAQAAYANEPGLETQPGIAATANSTLGNLLSSVSAGLSGLTSGSLGSLGGLFSPQSGGSNDPGLETLGDENISYPGTDNSALVAANAYSPGGSIFNSDTGYSYGIEDPNDATTYDYSLD